MYFSTNYSDNETEKESFVEFIFTFPYQPAIRQYRKAFA
jgi:hypothetical protein